MRPVLVSIDDFGAMHSLTPRDGRVVGNSDIWLASQSLCVETAQQKGEQSED